MQRKPKLPDTPKQFFAPLWIPAVFTLCYPFSGPRDLPVPVPVSPQDSGSFFLMHVWPQKSTYDDTKIVFLTPLVWCYGNERKTLNLCLIQTTQMYTHSGDTSFTVCIFTPIQVQWRHFHIVSVRGHQTSKAESRYCALMSVRACVSLHDEQIYLSGFP